MINTQFDILTDDLLKTDLDIDESSYEQIRAELKKIGETKLKHISEQLFAKAQGVSKINRARTATLSESQIKAALSKLKSPSSPRGIHIKLGSIN